MKIKFGHCSLKYFDDHSVQFGFGWYRHHKDHPWFGFTFVVHLLFWRFNVDYISDYKAYQDKMDRRREKWTAYKERISKK